MEQADAWRKQLALLLLRDFAGRVIAEFWRHSLVFLELISI